MDLRMGIIPGDGGRTFVIIIANIVAELMVTAEESDRIFYLYFKVMEEIDEEIRQHGLHPGQPGRGN